MKIVTNEVPTKLEIPSCIKLNKIRILWNPLYIIPFLEDESKSIFYWKILIYSYSKPPLSSYSNSVRLRNFKNILLKLKKKKRWKLNWLDPILVKPVALFQRHSCMLLQRIFTKNSTLKMEKKQQCMQLCTTFC